MSISPDRTFSSKANLAYFADWSTGTLILEQTGFLSTNSPFLISLTMCTYKNVECRIVECACNFLVALD